MFLQDVHDDPNGSENFAKQNRYKNRYLNTNTCEFDSHGVELHIFADKAYKIVIRTNLCFVRLKLMTLLCS